MTGEAAVDQLDVRDAANAPLAGFKHLAVVVTELKPLESVTHLGKIYLDGLTVHVVRNRDGSLNFTSLAAGKPPSSTAAAPQAIPSPVAMQTIARSRSRESDGRETIGRAEPCGRDAIRGAEPEGVSDSGRDTHRDGDTNSHGNNDSGRSNHRCDRDFSRNTDDHGNHHRYCDFRRHSRQPQRPPLPPRRWPPRRRPRRTRHSLPVMLRPRRRGRRNRRRRPRANRARPPTSRWRRWS